MTITTTGPVTGTGWTADASTFGARLALIRQRMGWGNVARAAKECGLPVDSWRNWETDGREPHRLTTVAKQIAGATGCDYLWLVHGPDRGQGGVGDVTRWYRPLSERLIERRDSAPDSAERPTPAISPQPHSPVPPTQRRPRPIGSPDRGEIPAG